VLDPREGVRLPGVVVTAAGQKATTTAGGAATLGNLPAGSQQFAIDPASLPPYYQAASLSVQVPQVSQLVFPVTLPIGTNTPNIYMGFGDSITVGVGSSDGTGYLDVLVRRLRDHFGVAGVINDGIEATRSNAGALRVARSLRVNQPAFLLIHYGTNDWNDATCRNSFPCFTIDSLRAIVEACQAARTLPMLATIIPPNTGFNPFASPERQVWVHMMDALIRDLARQEGALLVDLEAAFLAQPDLSALFVDHVHPNDAGYKIMADTFFSAITAPPGAKPSAAAPAFELPPIGADGHSTWPSFPSVIPPDPWDQGSRRR
jgi:acyl-CoA thioesterase-1